MVYAIGLSVSYFNGVRQVSSRPDRSLRRIAEETGGGYFELEKSDALASTFTRVSTELRSQYLMAFTPETLDGKVHKLDVRGKRPGITVRARKSYSASRPPPPTGPLNSSYTRTPGTRPRRGSCQARDLLRQR